MHRISASTEPPIETPAAARSRSAGRSRACTRRSSRKRRRQFLAVGQTGELALCGPQVAAGYLGDEEQTARRFPMLDHPQLGKTRWYLTGDSAYLDEHGLLHCLGRIDNQVKVMGLRVELEEIEAHLRAVCKTETVAAVAWPMVNGNRRRASSRS